MNDQIGEPLCTVTVSGRWVEAITYDDSHGRGRPQKSRLLFKTAAEATECARRLNKPWRGVLCEACSTAGGELRMDIFHESGVPCPYDQQERLRK